MKRKTRRREAREGEMTQFKCLKLFRLSGPGCIKPEKVTGDLQRQRNTEKKSKKKKRKGKRVVCSKELVM